MPVQRAMSSDADIRQALHRKKLRHLRSCADVLVVDELGLAHAKSRIDVAVINGSVHGYEIKSAKDSLVRLPQQIRIYQDTLERLTIVCASRHVAGVERLAPSWCGITEAVEGPRGGISFETVRRGKSNPDVDRRMLAHLLWRPEAVALLSRFDVPVKDLRRPRKQLYELIAGLLSAREITASIREFMQQRRTWRDHQAPA